MEDKKIAGLLAGMTATISELCKILIEDRIISEENLVKRLYRLDAMASNESPDSAAPIRHLINIIENK